MGVGDDEISILFHEILELLFVSVLGLATGSWLDWQRLGDGNLIDTLTKFRKEFMRRSSCLPINHTTDLKLVGR